MTINLNDFNSFAEFGRTRLSETPLSLDELVVEWESLQNRDDINAAIREGLEDAKAGRGRPAGEVTAELRKKHRIPTE